jgi:hypothetical protein
MKVLGRYRPYGWLGTVGVILPSANTVMEPELAMLARFTLCDTPSDNGRIRRRLESEILLQQPLVGIPRSSQDQVGFPGLEDEDNLLCEPRALRWTWYSY